MAHAYAWNTSGGNCNLKLDGREWTHAGQTLHLTKIGIGYTPKGRQSHILWGLAKPGHSDGGPDTAHRPSITSRPAAPMHGRA